MISSKPASENLESEYATLVYGIATDLNFLVKISLETEKQQIIKFPYSQKIIKIIHCCSIPNGEQLYYGSLLHFGYQARYSGVTFIVKQNNEIQMLKSGPETPGGSITYFDGAIYVFGGDDKSFHRKSSAKKFTISQNKGDILPESCNEICRCTCIEFQQMISERAGFKYSF